MAWTNLGLIREPLNFLEECIVREMGGSYKKVKKKVVPKVWKTDKWFLNQVLQEIIICKIKQMIIWILENN